MMVSLNLQALEDHLKAMRLQPQLQKETNQLIVIFKAGGADFPLFYRIYEGGELLQHIAFIPCQLKATAAPELARLLHLINKEVDLPGFGMDERAGIVYYRFMIPADHGQVSSETLETVFNSIQTICESFAPVIAAVATGNSSFDEVMRKLSSQK